MTLRPTAPRLPPCGTCDNTRATSSVREQSKNIVQQGVTVQNVWLINNTRRQIKIVRFLETGFSTICTAFSARASVTVSQPLNTAAWSSAVSSASAADEG